METSKAFIKHYIELGIRLTNDPERKAEMNEQQTGAASDYYSAVMDQTQTEFLDKMVMNWSQESGHESTGLNYSPKVNNPMANATDPPDGEKARQNYLENEFTNKFGNFKYKNDVEIVYKDKSGPGIYATWGYKRKNGKYRIIVYNDAFEEAKWQSEIFHTLGHELTEVGLEADNRVLGTNTGGLNLQHRAALQWQQDIKGVDVSGEIKSWEKTYNKYKQYKNEKEYYIDQSKKLGLPIINPYN